MGRRRQRPGRAGGAPAAAAAAAVNPPGRSQHCGAASPARPRTAAPLLPLAASRPPPLPRARRPRRAGRPAWLPSPAPTGGRAALRRRGGEGWAGWLVGDDAELLRCPQLHKEEHAVGPGLLQVPAGSCQVSGGRGARSPGPTSAVCTANRRLRGCVGSGPRSWIPTSVRGGERAWSSRPGGARGPRSTCASGGSAPRAPPGTKRRLGRRAGGMSRVLAPVSLRGDLGQVPFLSRL